MGGQDGGDGWTRWRRWVDKMAAMGGQDGGRGTGGGPGKRGLTRRSETVTALRAHIHLLTVAGRAPYRQGAVNQ